MLLLPSARKKRNDHSVQTRHRMLWVSPQAEGMPHVRNSHNRYCQNFHSLIIHMLHHLYFIGETSLRMPLETQWSHLITKINPSISLYYQVKSLFILLISKPFVFLNFTVSSICCFSTKMNKIGTWLLFNIGYHFYSPKCTPFWHA